MIARYIWGTGFRCCHKAVGYTWIGWEREKELQWCPLFNFSDKIQKLFNLFQQQNVSANDLSNTCCQIWKNIQDWNEHECIELPLIFTWKNRIMDIGLFFSLSRPTLVRPQRQPCSSDLTSVHRARQISIFSQILRIPSKPRNASAFRRVFLGSCAIFQLQITWTRHHLEF